MVPMIVVLLLINAFILFMTIMARKKGLGAATKEIVKDFWGGEDEEAKV